MKVAGLSQAELARLLRRGELLLELPPFVARLRSDVPGLAQDITAMYGEFAFSSPDAFADFSVEVSMEPGLRRWYKPQARFFYDGQPSFAPLPADQAFPMIEWGLNWCVAAHAHQYLTIHAAVIERGGRAAVLPAPPGSGKSTLCAGLIQRGWRLLSDELALLDMDSGMIHGMARPVSLKNASIDVIRAFAPEAVMTAPVPDTVKGTVSLLQPPPASVARVREPARAAWIVLPSYEPDALPVFSPHGKERAFMTLAEQSFNYDMHGAPGFEAMGRLVDQCECLRFNYGRLEDAAAAFERLAASSPP
ncbi:MAG: HprK-related kinase A [Vitreoscilla sp.]